MATQWDVGQHDMACRYSGIERLDWRASDGNAVGERGESDGPSGLGYCVRVKIDGEDRLGVQPCPCLAEQAGAAADVDRWDAR